jgi:hypothetical protein
MMTRRILLLGIIVCAAFATGAIGWREWQSYQASRQIIFIIPAGTVERIAAGETLSVLPATIELERGVRDILVIENEDTQAIQVGPYLIAPGQRFSQQYHNRGTFDLLCSVHASQRMQVVVR